MRRAGGAAPADDAWFEVQYNARASVPNHAEVFAGYEALSRRARLNRPCYLDVAYGDDALETLDIFPAAGPARAVLTFIPMNADLRLDDNAARVASPVTYRPARSVPLVAAVGARESSEFRRQSALLGEHWPHCRCERLEVAEADHFTILQHLARPHGVLFQALERLARELD